MNKTKPEMAIHTRDVKKRLNFMKIFTKEVCSEIHRFLGFINHRVYSCNNI